VNIIHGHLNSIILEESVGKYLHYEKSRSVFYICGPFAYMRMIAITLPLLGFSHEQIYREIYLPEINESKVIIPPDNTEAKVTILTGNQRHEIHVPAGKTILRAALENGIKLPYSCEAGICSTCSALRIEGKVEMSINEVLTDKDIAAGLVLTCTGYPVSPDVSIRF
jgi:ring-1,2-phenylacetyl-CoA epoxidase subunit PaaE